MGAIKQYTEIFRQHRDLVESNSASVMNSLRNKAMKALEEYPLPKKGSENYEHIDLEKLLSPDFGLNLARVNIDVNPSASFRCEVPNMSTSLFMLINDSFARSENAFRGLPEGIEVKSLIKAAEEDPETVGMYYGKLASLENPLVALDTLLAQDGIFIRVKRGVTVEKPIQLVNILQNGMSLMAVRRILIVMEENSSLQILTCDHTQNPDVDFLSLCTTEIFVKEGARLDLYDLEESTERTTRLSSLYLSQDKDSDVLIDGITLFNGTTRNEYHCSFNAPGSSLKLLGMGIEDGSRTLDTYSYIDHRSPRCKSDELFKYSVDDAATGSFTGRIHVAPGAEKTEAYQANRNLVGSDKALMFSKPQLEIYNDDVKCSHGTAIGQLDSLQLFYMRTRGLSEQTARMLLKQAFMADVIDGVRLDQLRDRLHHLVEMRFKGELVSCSQCGKGCL